MTATDQEHAREEAWARFPNDAEHIDSGARPTRCRSKKCQQIIWWGLTARGKQAPFDIKPNGEYTGTNHWRTCLDRQKFKKGGRR
jgi:hypothetical protein